jgi:hypothetical protein
MRAFLEPVETTGEERTKNAAKAEPKPCLRMVGDYERSEGEAEVK